MYISYCKDNNKCDSASNAPKCPLNNGVSIVQKLVVKLSNTSTMLFLHIAKTLSSRFSIKSASYHVDQNRSAVGAHMNADCL